MFFLLEYSKVLGFYPTNNYSAENSSFELQQGMFTKEYDNDNYFILPPDSEYFAKIIDLTFEQFYTISIPKQIRQLLLKKLIIYYQFHLHDFKTPQSLQVLEDMYIALK